MSGYLAGKLMYWMAILIVLGVLFGTYLIFTKVLPIEHPLRQFLETQNKKGFFLLTQKVAIGLLLASLVGVVILYG